MKEGPAETVARSFREKLERDFAAEAPVPSLKEKAKLRDPQKDELELTTRLTARRREQKEVQANLAAQYAIQQEKRSWRGRCSHEGCNKLARGGTWLCRDHGRCSHEGCDKTARESTGLCTAHSRVSGSKTARTIRRRESSNDDPLLKQEHDRLIEAEWTRHRVPCTISTPHTCPHCFRQLVFSTTPEPIHPLPPCTSLILLTTLLCSLPPLEGTIGCRAHARRYLILLAPQAFPAPFRRSKTQGRRIQATKGKIGRRFYETRRVAQQ